MPQLSISITLQFFLHIVIFRIFDYSRVISRNEKIVFSDNFPMKKNVASKKSHKKIETVITKILKFSHVPTFEVDF